MTMTSRYGLNLIAESQSARVPANEFLLWLEAVKAGRAKSRAVTAQPGSPVDGDLYVLLGTPTGAAWSGQGNKYAWRFNGAWRFYPFVGGDLLYLEDESLWIGYHLASTTWRTISSSSGAILPPPGSATNQWLFSNGTTWAGAYMPMHHTISFLASNATAVNTALVGVAQTSLVGINNAGFSVASGKTFVLLAATLAARTGATVGTYTLDCVIVDGAGTETVLATGTGAANTDVRLYAENIATGLYAIPGPTTLRVGWRNRTGGPGALAAANHYASVGAIFI